MSQINECLNNTNIFIDQISNSDKYFTSKNKFLNTKMSRKRSEMTHRLIATNVRFSSSFLCKSI